jgi:hypothetical protein
MKIVSRTETADFVTRQRKRATEHVDAPRIARAVLGVLRIHSIDFSDGSSFGEERRDDGIGHDVGGAGEKRGIYIEKIIGGLGSGVRVAAAAVLRQKRKQNVLLRVLRAAHEHHVLKKMSNTSVLQWVGPRPSVKSNG